MDNKPELIPYRKGDKWGFCDRNKRIVIECKYDSAYCFSDDVAVVSQHDPGYYPDDVYFINRFGEKVTSDLWEVKLPNGFEALVSKNKISWINLTDMGALQYMHSIELYKDGYFLIEGYHHIYSFVFVDGRDYPGFANTSFISARPFSEGLAAVQKLKSNNLNDCSGSYFINIEGIAKTKEYYHCGNFSGGLAPVKELQGGCYGYIDKTGRQIISAQYAKANDFTDGVATVCNNYNRLWGVIDKAGKQITSFVYDDMGNFKDGFVKVKSNSKWGFIDKLGKQVTQFIYDSVSDFLEGMAAVKLNGKYGFIDSSGNNKVYAGYEEVLGFSEGLAGVKNGTKWGFIDKSGNKIIPFIYDEVHAFSNGLSFVELNGTDGYIDKTGMQYWED